jgi:hypothetical protein
MRRSLTAWCVAVPLALVGSQVAHAVDYRIVAPNPDERAHLLAETGHRYLALLPLALALATMLVLFALVAEARRARSRPTRALSPWHFALMAPLLFACQEVFERLAHDGTFPYDAFAQRTFLIGLALQLPFALAAFGVAWLLLRVAHAVGLTLSAPPALRGRSDFIAARCPRSVHVPRPALLSLGFGTRGPPVVSL